MKKNTTKLFISTLFLLAFAINGKAQENEYSNFYNQIKDYEKVSPFSSLSLGVEVGTTGFGIQLAAPLTHFLAIRAGFTYIPEFNQNLNINYDIEGIVSLNNIIENPLYPEVKQALIAEGLPTNINQFPTSTYLAANFFGTSTAKLLLDIYPTRGSSFRFTVGMMIASKNLLRASGGIPKQIVDTYDIIGRYSQQYGYNYPNEIDFGGEEFVVQDLKSIEAYAQVNSVRPYFGIGFGRPIPKKRVGLQFDLGAAYMGKAKIVGNTDKITRALNNELNSGGYDKYLSYASFYPVLSLQLNIRLFQKW